MIHMLFEVEKKAKNIYLVLIVFGLRKNIVSLSIKLNIVPPVENLENIEKNWRYCQFSNQV